MESSTCIFRQYERIAKLHFEPKGDDIVCLKSVARD
jgi:hypothetical protein